MSEKDNPDFLDDFVEKQEQPEAPEIPEPDATANHEKGDINPEPEKAKEPEAPPAPEPDKAANVPIAALMAERDKRQQLQRELEELRKQQPEPEKADFYTDPQRFVRDEVSRVQQEANNRLLAALEAHARSSHEDYDEVMAEVKAYAETNPAVAAEIMSSANPALSAYQYGKKLRALKEIDDPEAYKAKVIAEARAQWEAELAAKEEAKRKAADAIPPDLSTARSPAAGGAPVGDPFDELFPRN